jgi:titin
MVLTPAQPTWQAPWPVLDEQAFDSVAKWDAVRLDTDEVFANDRVFLPPDCPPPPIVPGAPENVTSTPGNGSVLLLWSAPTWDGGSPVTGYQVDRRPAGHLVWTPVGSVDASTTGLTVTGLTNGVTYMFQITAMNANGPGEPVEAKDTPRTVPSAVASLAAAPTNGSGQIRLTWVPGFDGGTEITDYVVHRSPNGIDTWSLVSDGTSTATAVTVSGLTNGTRFYFRVYPVNDVGIGAVSSVASAIPRSAPSAPRSLVATPTNRSGEVRVTWVVPAANGGAPITDYVIQRSPNGTSGWVTIPDGTGVGTGFTVAGLTNGVRYYFRVSARNAAGSGQASATATAVPRNVLTAPRSLTAVPTNRSGEIRLTWLGPASDGGRTITDYVIQRSPNGTSAWTTVNDGVGAATSATVSGLANATRYYFRVFARTGTITGPASNPATAIPRTTPSAPLALTAQSSYAGYSLRWVAPRANGAAITDYVVQFKNRAGIWTTYPDGVSPAPSAWFGVLGVKCLDIRVAAVNAAGVGAFSYLLGVCYRVP